LPPEIISLVLDNDKIFPTTDHGTTYGEAVAPKLPPELMEMVRQYFEEDPPGSLMGENEAMEHRIKLMDERGSFVRKAEGDWQEEKYNFCEH
jgi:hypothetical protein